VHGNWLVLLLVALNIPIMVFLVWLVFDDVRDAKEHLPMAILKALACVISFGLMRYILMNDEDDSFANSIGVFLAYAFVIAGEYWLISKYWPSLIAEPFLS